MSQTMQTWKKISLFFVSVTIIAGAIYMLNGGNPTEALLKAIGKGKMSSEELKTVKSAHGVINLEHWVTDKGARVYFVHSPNLPMVDIQVAFDAGSARDGSKGGLAYLTNSLITDGTKDMTADQIAEAFDSIGSQISGYIDRDMSLLHLKSLTDTDVLSDSVKLLGRVLSEPTFPEKSFLREQQSSLKMLDYEAQQPGTVAEKAFYTTVYQSQPYGNWPHGTETSLKSLTQKDLIEFHKQYYTAKNAVVTVVGAVDREVANAIAEAITDLLPMGNRAASLPAVKPLVKAVETKVSFPSEQVHIMFGNAALKRIDPDYIPLIVGNHVLGSNGSVTRLFNAVRHEKGLAYSVHSYFDPMRQEGPYIVGCQTKKSTYKEAYDVMDSTLKSFVTDGPTEQELNDAKENLVGGFPLRFDSNEAIATQVTILGFYDLPLDYFDNYVKGMKSVTIEMVKDAFKRRIQPDQMALVLVGAVE